MKRFFIIKYLKSNELLKDSMLKKTYIGDLCDKLNLNETAVTIEEFLKYFV